MSTCPAEGHRIGQTFFFPCYLSFPRSIDKPQKFCMELKMLGAATAYQRILHLKRTVTKLFNGSVDQYNLWPDILLLFRKKGDFSYFINVWHSYHHLYLYLYFTLQNI